MEITNTAVKKWIDEIDHSKKREKDFRKNGESIIEINNGEKPNKMPFNILYSNTETLTPALYSQTPRPVVKRRFNQDEKPAVEAAEKAGTRMLEYLLDTNMEGYERFDDSMMDAVLDAALPGRGITQIKFDAEMEVVESEIEIEDEDSELEIEEASETVKWAFVCTDSRKWDRVYFGFAHKWADMPWIAFEDYLDEGECKKIFGEEIAEKLKYTENEDDEETDDSGEKSSTKTAIIYQIWDKTDKKVKWVSPQYDGFLKEQDDPLQITGFFPIPKPLMLHRKSNNLMPTALYTMYENQAKELNRITVRLNKIIEAIKFRGVYDGAFGDDLEKIFDGDDNDLIPTEKGASLVEGGFDKAIWILPLGELVGVAQQLFSAREECKRVIYEITGLSDIIRGQSKASETLGAQQIKASWGTMRLKNMQKEVQYYVRDSLRIMLDVASQKIPERFWPKITGLPYPTDDERDKAKAELQALQQQMQQQAQVHQQQQQQIAQMAQSKGEQPPPPQPLQQQPPPPELIALVEAPSWSEILEILRDDFIRSYKIDIETNSTLDVEATEDKQQVGEFMNALAQFMNGAQPMVENGTLPFGAMKSMLLEITRRYRFGMDVENEIKSMQEPPKQNTQQQMEQMKQQQKQMQQQQQEMQKMSQTIEQNKRKAGEELDKRFIKLEQEKMQLEYDKKLAAEQQKFNEKLALQRVDMKASDKENDMKSLFEKQKRDLQSMLDKQVARVENAAKSTVNQE